MDRTHTSSIVDCTFDDAPRPEMATGRSNTLLGLLAREASVKKGFVLENWRLFSRGINLLVFKLCFTKETALRVRAASVLGVPRRSAGVLQVPERMLPYPQGPACGVLARCRWGACAIPVWWWRVAWAAGVSPTGCWSVPTVPALACGPQDQPST